MEKARVYYRGKLPIYSLRDSVEPRDIAESNDFVIHA
jgi:hypothetical protein